MGPEDFHLGKSAQQVFDSIICGVGIEKDTTFTRQLGKAANHERIGLSGREVKLPNSPVDPVLQTFFYIRKDCPIPGPRRSDMGAIEE